MGLKVAAIFSDNMVLQRSKEIAVFGQGEDGKQVTVRLTIMEGKQRKNVEEQVVVSDGRWIVYLPKQKENTGCTMVITDGDIRKEFRNIAIGEVWFCGGQSNMEFELQNITGGNAYLQNESPNVRFYQVQRKAYIDNSFLQSEESTTWEEFDSEKAKTWSGVGYLFGKKLSEKLGVTVGLVGCNWGGTSASNWMSRDCLASDPLCATYLDDYRIATEGKEEETLIKEYEEYLKYEVEWNQKCNELYATVPGISWDEVQERIGVCQWPGPMCAKHPFRPSGLYETMVKRVVPYTMKGWLYYQGESDDHKPHCYYNMMKLLIHQWREDWMDQEMPFLLVQLPGHRYIQEEDRKHWCVIREAQEKIAENTNNVGMAVVIDAGEYDNIHPQNKEPVADRLYRQAMYKVYEKLSEEEAQSPVFESYLVEEDKLFVSFKYVSSGLKIVGDKKEIIGFEVAGADGVYYPAKAYIEGNGIIVNCNKVKTPAAVRYLWTNYPMDGVNLYNRYGLPVAPFRSLD